MSEAKSKKLTLSDDDITYTRKQPSAASLANVGGGPGAAGKHVGAGSDPDSAAPVQKKPQAPSDPDGS